jgi:hypothetical protein
MSMRLTLSALLSAALLASPALAHGDHRRDMSMRSPDADMPPPPFPGPGSYRGPMMDPRWEHDQERMHHEWMERCRDHHGEGDRNGPAYREGCGYPPPPAYGYGYPGAYMGYAVPMVMVPVLRSKPCKEVVEEIVEEVVPVRRRLIGPRQRIVHDKRVLLHDKRVPIAPSKRIPY